VFLTGGGGVASGGGEKGRLMAGLCMSMCGDHRVNSHQKRMVPVGNWEGTEGLVLLQKKGAWRCLVALEGKENR